MRSHAKLTAAAVQAIRKDDRPARVVAAEYGVSWSMVARIRRGHAWKPKPAKPARVRQRPANAKLTPRIAEQIRSCSLSLRALAKVFAVHPSTVASVRAGETWRDA